MTEINYILDDDLSPYVNCIMVSESNDVNSHTNIPIYADGYPGIMYQQAVNGFYLLPKNKKLSELFLYGQTIDPISLDVKGVHRSIIVQLYPFASKYLINIDPRILNDDCYDLLQIDYVNIENFRSKLNNASSIHDQIEVILNLMRALIAAHKVGENDAIQKAISIILNQKGQIKIKELIDQVYLTERTLERYFLSFIGLTPKQFSKIIQFQSSMNSLSKTNFDSLLDVGLESGFSDQSHFIRTFKQYTGQTPSFYLNAMNNR